MVFALLRLGLGTACIDAEVGVFAECLPDDWQKCFKVAKIQGVAALAWDGVLILPKELHPPMSIKIPWGIYAENCEKKYRSYCSAIGEMSEMFAAKGVATMQIKGVGFASHYPIPAHREGGDIDIFTYSSDLSKMSHKEANDLVDSMMSETMKEAHTYKHSCFTYKGIPVENHKCFLNVARDKNAQELDAILLQLMDPVQTPLLNGEVSILTPSLPFCTIHIAHHALSHYPLGMRLHHLCDWAMILREGGLTIPKEVTDRDFIRWINNLTLLCNQYLGTCVEVQGGSAKEASEIYMNCVSSRYIGVVPYKDPLRVLLYKTRRFVWSNSAQKKYKKLSHTWFYNLIYHFKHPKTFFTRT